MVKRSAALEVAYADLTLKQRFVHDGSFIMQEVQQVMI